MNAEKLAALAGPVAVRAAAAAVAAGVSNAAGARDWYAVPYDAKQAVAAVVEVLYTILYASPAAIVRALLATDPRAGCTGHPDQLDVFLAALEREIPGLTARGPDGRPMKEVDGT